MNKNKKSLIIIPQNIEASYEIRQPLSLLLDCLCWDEGCKQEEQKFEQY